MDEEGNLGMLGFCKSAEMKFLMMERVLSLKY